MIRPGIRPRTCRLLIDVTALVKLEMLRCTGSLPLGLSKKRCTKSKVRHLAQVDFDISPGLKCLFNYICLLVVHKDGIRRVLLTESIGGTTERYFDQAELRDLFKLAPPDAPCSMLTKFNGQSAVGSTGKQSFLTTHSRVVGVASHDLLYNNARGNKESSTVDLTSSTTDTPFSRQPFMSSAENKANNSVDCIQVDESPKCKPLGGGLSRTRQNREDAKAHHNEKALKETAVAAGSKGSMVASVIRRSEVLISKNEYAHAMDEMLGLLESENHLIQGNVKLKVHENISFLANKLGWL